MCYKHTRMKVLFVGDIHIKHENLTEVNGLIDYFKQQSSPFVDLIVLAGDLLHTHERLHTQLLNKAYDLVKACSVHHKTLILVGNHDYINNQQFLTNRHWMNGMKYWPNVTVIDRVLHEGDFVFVPYVPVGRLVDALNTVPTWRDATCIFAHQELRGCKMGAIVSTEGDEWLLDYPLVISGHIHEPQRPQANVIYPGSVINHAFGYNSQGMYQFDFENKKLIAENYIDLGFEKKILYHVEVNKLNTIHPNQMTNKSKFNVSGTLSEIRQFKTTEMYQALSKLSHVTLKIIKPKKENITFRTRLKSFETILEQMVVDRNNKKLLRDYKTCQMILK